MGLGKTFTNSIVREIGRNLGKGVSNEVFGDWHSTPIRVVKGGANDITKKRGRVYQNNFDMSIKKFEIKGAQATFNQVLNIHSEFFTLIEEANADGTIDLNEMTYLLTELPNGVKTLERAKSALIDLNKQDFADKTEEKIESFKEFLKSLDEALVIDNLPSTKFNPIALLFFFLSFIGLDRIYFYPKKFWSIFYALLGLAWPVIISVAAIYGIEKFDDFELLNSTESTGYIMRFILILSVTMPFWYGLILNPYKGGGYWRYRKVKKHQKNLNKLARSLKELMKARLAQYYPS
ncbi:MAG: hypothetical protein P8L83_00015 [Flavobacteriaceae bacterium]|nr:hypothetical protein [Flavobacteriaceae bacterium]